MSGGHVKKGWPVLLLALAVLLGLGAYLKVQVHTFLARPCGRRNVEKVVVVKPGQSLRALLDALHADGIVDSPLRLRLLARIAGYDRRIQAGEYRLSAAMRPRELLDTLARGKVLCHKLTIPEGYTQYQIARAFEKSGIGSAAAFLKAAADKALLKRLGIDAPTAEGYLFPDTYFFEKGVAPQTAVETMIARFWETFDTRWRARAGAMGLGVHQVVILASMIEKETADPDERPLIASVFYNRMKRHMRLESDPTVIYGIRDFNGNLTRKDLDTPTPYNTYRRRGLPAGPIANPGAAALKAALYPADTRFLYFVARRDGTHQFSTSLEAHRRAVRKYQRRLR